MRKTSFDIPEDLKRKADIASAACGMSTAEFIRGALLAALMTMAEHDAAIATYFDVIERRAAEARETVIA